MPPSFLDDLTWDTARARVREALARLDADERGASAQQPAPGAGGAPPPGWSLPRRGDLVPRINSPQPAASPFMAPAPAAQPPAPFPFPDGRVQPWEAERRRQATEANMGANIGAAVGAFRPIDRSAPLDRIRIAPGRPDYWAPRVPERVNPPREAFPFPMVNPPPGSPIPETPIEMASRVSGAPHGYLRALAAQEGLDDPDAKNPRSSATGLMQFTEDTWLQMLAEHGERYGLPRELQAAIERKPNGSGYFVRDPGARAALMELRRSPHWSALLGGELFNQSNETLQDRLGRPVSPAETYAAGHFLGEDAGAYMLREVDGGRGDRDAREAIRDYYQSIRRPDQAEAVIEQNPRQFAPGNTVADLMRMQTEDFAEHGARRGVDPGELRRPHGLARSPYRQEMPVRRSLFGF